MGEQVSGPPVMPEIPYCLACSHQSTHSVGPIGMCYKDQCGCMEPEWLDPALTDEWRRYSEDSRAYYKQANEAQMVNVFREMTGDTSIPDEKIIEYAYWADRS